MADEQLACPICGGLAKVKSLAFYHGKVVSSAYLPDYIAGWFYCKDCECIYQDKANLEISTTYDEAYHLKYRDMGPAVFCQTQTFLPEVEKQTSGRSLLDVGDSQPFVARCAHARGWFPTMLDMNPAVKDAPFPSLCGNFEDFDFEDRRYNCIWASHILEHFIDPLVALKKMYGLLYEKGCLYLAAPDAFFVMTGRAVDYLPRTEHHIIFTLQAMLKHVQKVGFKVIFKGRNSQQGNFPTWLDWHIVAQRRQLA